MREIAFLLIATLILVIVGYHMASGIYSKCSDCDDGNVCTYDLCDKNDTCIHEAFDGPVDGCYGTGGCIQYTCLNGSCIPQSMSDCCGNNKCEEEEDYLKCPRDCKASCSDGILNQAESDIDCGGPCEPCGNKYVNYLRKIGSFRDEWYDVSLSYNEAVNNYNRDNNLNVIRKKTFETFSKVVEIQYRLNLVSPPIDMTGLHKTFGTMITLYLQSLDSMIIYTSSKDSTYLDAANDFMAKSLANDSHFVALFNEYAAKMNQIQINCNNGVYDEGEEAIDCGEICNTSCVERVKVSKWVTVENTAYPTKVKLNVSSPAIHYPPYQKVLKTHLEPVPLITTKDDEGNLGYVYELDFKGKGIKEIKITQIIELHRGMTPGKSDIKPIDVFYGFESKTTGFDIMCGKAKEIKYDSNTTYQTIMNIYDWMDKNIEYHQDEEELGALYAFQNSRGACDEHADLAVVFSKCLDIPARRVVGYLINSSSIDGHAWIEYYDEGWIYLDPSVKGSLAGAVTDGRHVVSCVGDKAYNCGLSYSYTFQKYNKPELNVEENVYVG